MLREVPLLLKDPGLKMAAASGSAIDNLGTKVIRFRATPPGVAGRVWAAAGEGRLSKL